MLCDDETSTETRTLFMQHTIEVAASLVDWRNRFELVKLLPNEIHFRKWAAIAFLELLVKDSGTEEWKADVRKAVKYMVKVNQSFLSRTYLHLSYSRLIQTRLSLPFFFRNLMALRFRRQLENFAM